MINYNMTEENKTTSKKNKKGFTQVPNSLIKDETIDPTEKMILIKFLSYGEKIYPSIKTICKDLCITKPTVIKKIKELQEKGYLKVIKNKSKCGDYDNNSYEVVKDFYNVVKSFDNSSKEISLQVVKNIDTNNTNKKILNNIYTHWNSKEIIVHKELTTDIQIAIEKALKKNTLDEIVQAIDLYSEALSSNFYFTHKWTIEEFLNKDNALTTFLENGNNAIEYFKWKRNNHKNNSFKDYF